MKKSTLVWLITATSLCLAGLIMFISVMTVYKWDFSKLSTVKLETKVFDVDADFTDISISGDTENIVFVPSKAENRRVVCKGFSNTEYAVEVSGGKLSVSAKRSRTIKDFVGIFFGECEITVYIPAGKYGNLNIETATGDTTIPKGYSFGNMDIKCSTGNINLSGITSDGDIKTDVSTGKTNFENIKCKNFHSFGSTGNATFKNVVATGKIYIKRNTGDITLKKSDAKELYIKTSTGDITGSLLTEKVFITDTSTGTVKVPKTRKGGKCEIKTSTGDIIFE